MKKKIAKLINTALEPVQALYRSVKKGLFRIRRKVPNVFDEIESILSSHLISSDVSRDLQANPDFDNFTKVITNEVARSIPNVQEESIRDIVRDKSSASFMDLLTRGLRTHDREKEFTKIKTKKLFKRMLVANRGEIAIRIIRACKELGIETVQIYTETDKAALAVKFADKAVKLGKNPSDYLDMEKIIKVAKKYKVDSIHPGYGFLAENAEFAKLCTKNKIKFVGPSYSAILAMGDKINAKKIIKSSGVPFLEGTEKAVKNVSEGKKIAKNIGFPIIIKASAGGGGKGMRIVYKEDEFEESFNSCQSEALNAFKNKDVFIEKYVEDPKHVEFQILADQRGHVIHLGERDCSIQRRHQKLVEEAPSPALNRELRNEMGKAAVRVASAIEYEGAGTVEFLLDDQKNFYFMEMNTRIQVEHGITEMITGIDLVKEQIKIAAGATIAFKQKDIKISGWAIECRINAECPQEGFCPTTGVISNYLPPGGPGIRVCSSSHTGQEVSPHYDSMLAKLMCSGETREEAIDRMKRALNEFIVEGIDTTIPFHKVVLNSEAFLKGEVTTSFIEKNNIMQLVNKAYKQEKKALTKEEKAIIVTTAIAEYQKRKHKFNDKKSAWVRAARQEALAQE